jgi:hypothetical protein
MSDLQRLMAERFGAEMLQLSLYLRLPAAKMEEEDTVNY